MNGACHLKRAVGIEEVCPGEPCPFWEPGGAVLPGDCLVERLGVETRDRKLAGYLLEIRDGLKRSSDAVAEASRIQFARRLGAE